MFRHSMSRYRTRLAVEIEIEEIEKEMGQKMSRDEVIRHLFGDTMDTPDTDLDLAILNPPAEDGLKVWNRLNYIWVLPVAYLLVGPFTFFVKGRFRLTGGNWFTRLLFKAVGEKWD